MTELFKVVLEMSVTGAIIIAAVMLIRLCMKRLPRRYAYFLWIIPAIRLLCPFTVSSEVSLFNLFPTQSVQVEYEERIVTEQTVELPETAIPQETTPVVTVHYPEQPEQPSQPQDTVNEKQPSEEAVQRKVSAISIVSIVWLTGTAAMLVYVASSYIRTYRRISSAALLQNNIFISHSIDTPFVFGLIKPKIYIPDGISGTDLQYILAHENAHIKRLDHAAKLLAMVILSVHWFNPLVWLGFKLMTDDMELSCDEKALGSYDVEDRKAYATTLLNMSVRQNSLNLGGMLSFGESGIKTRIKGVLAMKKPKAIACVLAVAVIIAAAVCLLTSAEKLVVEDGERAIVTVTGTYAKYPENTSEIDSREIAKLLNSFNVKKIDREDIYIPDAITAYSVTIYHKNNMDYDQISFYSPAYESDNIGNDIFRFIAVNTVTIRDNQPNIELLDFYKLSDSDWDKLCRAIVPKFEAFPEGDYVSTQLEHQILRVTKENGIPHFELYEDDECIWAFDPDRFEAAGLVAAAGKDESGITKVRFIGNGVIEIDAAPTSSVLSVANPFIWQEKHTDEAEEDNTFTAVVIEEQSDDIYGNYLVKPIEGELELSSSDKFYISAETGLKQGELIKITHDGRIMETYPAQVEELSVERVTTVSPDNAVRQYYYAEDNASVNEIKIGQINSTVTWQYKFTPLSEKFGIAEDSEIIEAIVDYTANGVSQSVVAVIESNQQFGFRVVDTFPYEPKILYGTILEVTETDIDGSKQFYIVQPEGTSDEVRVYSFAMYGDYITGDAANTFNVGDKVEVKYNGTLEYGKEGNNQVFSMKAVESQVEQADVTLCTDYLNDYWNYLFKTGEFNPDDYISDADMLALANKRKLAVEDTLGHGIENVEVIIDSGTVQSGTNSDGRKWLCFVYDLQRNLEDGNSTTEYYQGYTAYFELDSDGRIFREYQLYGTEKEVLGLSDEIILPIENDDIDAVIEDVHIPIGYRSHRYTSDVYELTPDGYGCQRDEDNPAQLEVKFMIPQDWEMDYSVASLDGEKIFEIGVPYPSEQGINYDNFKVDYGMGREITVHEEKIGTADDPFEYYIYSSVPDYYSDDKSYDTYTYVVSSGGYNISMHFISDAGVEKEVFEYVVRSLDISEVN